MLTEEEFKEGQVLLIDKPLTWTSFQVVNKIRWEIRQRFNIKKFFIKTLYNQDSILLNSKKFFYKDDIGKFKQPYHYTTLKK